MTTQKIKLQVWLQQSHLSKDEYYIKYIIPYPEEVLPGRTLSDRDKFIEIDIELPLPEGVVKVVE